MPLSEVGDAPINQDVSSAGSGKMRGGDGIHSSVSTNPLREEQDVAVATIRYRKRAEVIEGHELSGAIQER